MRCVNSISDNKRLAAEFFGCFTHGDVDGALARMSDDATWWIAGDPAVTPTSGVNDKKKMARMFKYMTGELKDGKLRFEVKGATAEDDRVALELEGRGELKNGRVYNNRYHLLITFRDGKVCAVREYLDTQHVFATWFAK
jgi:ketosteroid isomerase-like protein